jgi:hypothetical protein
MGVSPIKPTVLLLQITTCDGLFLWTLGTIVGTDTERRFAALRLDRLISKDKNSDSIAIEIPIAAGCSSMVVVDESLREEQVQAKLPKHS